MCCLPFQFPSLRYNLPNFAKSYIDAARQRGFDTVFATGLEPALRALASEGVLEVLVEAGPQLTQSVLASPFWDEHVCIIQGAAANAEDQIEIRRNCKSAAEPEAGERHVHRHW